MIVSTIILPKKDNVPSYASPDISGRLRNNIAMLEHENHATYLGVNFHALRKK
jgi:hypothetical protein